MIHDVGSKKSTAAALSLINLLPPLAPWFLRTLRRRPVPTMLGVAGAFLVLRAFRRPSDRRYL